MTAPDPRLDAIKDRLDAATPGPWVADTGTRGDCVVWGPNGRFLMNMQAEPHWLEYAGETRSVAFDVDKRDATFIANAPADVAYLLSVVEAQAAQITKVRELAESWHQRGEHDMAFSKTIPDENIAIVILDEGATKVENARHIRNALAEVTP